MSHIVFYIKLEPYLKQWLHNSLGNPVVFPPQSNENAVIRRFLRKRHRKFSRKWQKTS